MELVKFNIFEGILCDLDIREVIFGHYEIFFLIVCKKFEFVLIMVYVCQCFMSLLYVSGLYQEHQTLMRQLYQVIIVDMDQYLLYKKLYR